MKNSITVRKIETIRYFTNEFIILNIYISELINDKIEMIEIIVKVYLICNLKIKLLIDVNVLNLKEINISFHNCFLIINSEDEWEARIHVYAKNNICVCQKIWALKKQIISSHSLLTVLIEFKSALSTDQDFLFISIYSDAHTHLIDVNMYFIHVWNDSDQPIHISLKNGLGKIIEMKEEQCYYVDSNLHDLAAQKSAEDDKSNTLKSKKMNQVLTDLFVVSSTTNSIRESISQQNSEVLLSIINKNVSISFKIQIH